MRLRQAFHHMGMGGVYLILTSASLPHFKRINENATLNIFHKSAAANNTTSSFCKTHSLSISHKCQFSIRSVHAATLSLLNRLCKSFHNCLVLELELFKQKLPEESHFCLFPELWLGFKRTWLLGIITEPAKYPESLLSKDLLTPLKPECQTAMCSMNILLTFCSSWELQQDHKLFTPAHFHDLHAVQLGHYMAPIL